MNTATAADTPAIYKNKATARAVAWAKANPERTREIKREWNKRNPDAHTKYRNAKPLKQMLKTARHSALRRGIEFSISEGDLLLIDVCPVLGVAIDWTHGTKGKVQPNSPSIDRFDSSKGYTPGNVRVISFRANTIKSNATLDEMKSIVKYMSEGL